MDIAIQQVGAIVVPLYPNISENDYKYILNDASIKLIVVGNADLAQKIQNIRNEVPSLEHLFSFDQVEGVPNWSNIHGRAEETVKETVKELGLSYSGNTPIVNSLRTVGKGERITEIKYYGSFA